MMDKYIEVDGRPVLENNLEKWAAWYEKADRCVARTSAGRANVSTVFLGRDHSFPEDPGHPLLYETMVFGGKLDDSQERYTTREDALKGHKRWVRRAWLSAAPYPNCKDPERCFEKGYCQRDPCCFN